MLSFFKTNDPYRLIGALIVLIVFRLPYWLSDLPITIPMLEWKLVGMRMSEGFMNYAEIWHTLSPLSAVIYGYLYGWFGNSMWLAMEIISITLALLQCSLLNVFMLKNNVLSENTYLPAAIYALLLSLHFDFLVLSPVLIGSTFVVLALNTVFSQIEFRAKKDEKILAAGVYIGLSTLFHFPFIAIGLAVIPIFAMFTSTVLRRYFLYLIGLFLPLLLTYFYFLFQDANYFLFTNHLSAWFMITGSNYLSFENLIVLAAFTAIFVIAALFRIFSQGRLNNYQVRVTQSMFVFLLLSSAVLILEIDRNPYVLIIFVPFVTFFLSHSFSIMKRGFMGEVRFLVFVVGIFAINYVGVANTTDNNSWFGIEKYFLGSDTSDQRIDGKTAMILSEDVARYQNSQFPATPFLNWALSKDVWSNSANIDNQSLIGRSIENEKPEIIFDPNGIFSSILDNAPGIKSWYQKDGDYYYLLTGINN